MQPDQQQRIMGYFIEEAKDHLNTIEQGLLNLQSTIEDPEMINEVFRAAHSVKGGAAMLGLNGIQRVSHRMEDCFKVLKDTPIRVDQKLENLFLRAFDALQELLGQLQGPFGLTEEVSTQIVTGVEPTFGELDQHLSELTGSTGALPLPEIPLTSGLDLDAPLPNPWEEALEQLFRTEVPLRLREMLQLFKQPESDVASRQQLQELCRSLSSWGEQYQLQTWCHLVETARRAIAHPENSYRILAPIVIRDIKLAQELVLAGRTAEIAPCSQLSALVPAPAPLETVIQDDLADLLGITDDLDAVSVDSLVDPSLDLSFDEDLTTTPEAVDVSGGYTADLTGSGRGVRQGPAVGSAELNSLADLFEGELPELGLTWQQEEVLTDEAELLIPEVAPPSDENPSDFADLLFASSDPSPVSSSAADDLSDLFGDDLDDMPTQAIVTPPSSSPDPNDDFADLLGITEPSPTAESLDLDLNLDSSEDPFQTDAAFSLDAADFGDDSPLSGFDVTGTDLDLDGAMGDLGDLFDGLNDTDLPPSVPMQEAPPPVELDPWGADSLNSALEDLDLTDAPSLDFDSSDLTDLSFLDGAIPETPLATTTEDNALDDWLNQNETSETPVSTPQEAFNLEGNLSIPLEPISSEVADPWGDDLLNLDSAIPADSAFEPSSFDAEDLLGGNDLNGADLDLHSALDLPSESDIANPAGDLEESLFADNALEADLNLGTDLDLSMADLGEDSLFTPESDLFSDGGSTPHENLLEGDLFSDEPTPPDNVQAGTEQFNEGAADSQDNLFEVTDLFGDGESAPQDNLFEVTDLFGDDESAPQDNTVPEGADQSNQGGADSQDNLFEVTDLFGEGDSTPQESLLEVDNLFGEVDLNAQASLLDGDEAFSDGAAASQNSLFEVTDLFGEGDSTPQENLLEVDNLFGEVDSAPQENPPNVFETWLQPADDASLDVSQEFDDLLGVDTETPAISPEQVSASMFQAPDDLFVDSSTDADLSDLNELLDTSDEAGAIADFTDSPGFADLDNLDFGALDLPQTDQPEPDFAPANLLDLGLDSPVDGAEVPLNASLESDFSDLLDYSSVAESEQDQSLDDLDILLDEPAVDIAATDEFGDLENLLGEDDAAAAADFNGLVDEPALSAASFISAQPLLDDMEVDIAVPNAGTDDFSDLESLLSNDGLDHDTSSLAIPNSTIDESEFDDLNDLLKDAEEKMGGAPTIKVGGGLSNSRRTPRPGRVFSEQTMRVPVKHLDNLSNLVGELVVNRNSLEQDQERLRQSLDNLLYQVQQLSDVGQRMQDLYERSLLESSLLASRQGYRSNPLHVRSGDTTIVEAPTDHHASVEYDPLEMDRFTGFHSLSQEMIELIVRVRESSSDIEFIVDETEQVTRMFRQVTTQLQEGLTRSRMVPFAQTADRLPRAVRDISMKFGKQAELIIEGRETLIDKMILEQLYDPMTHLVNNAITHGIEPPAVRVAAGKPAAGRITIRAFHQGNQTIISVADDGAGIDIDRVKLKAVEKGLLSPEEARTMSRLDVYDILFHPGFTTKDQADDFSGRGVGMDVVRTSLSEIRGVINTDSNPGRGTSFTIRLPLTLSISKALCCISDRARIAFPMDGVEDMLDVPKERIQTNADNQSCIAWRDTILTVRPLSELLGYNRHLSRGNVYGGNQEDDMVSIVVLRSAGNFLALQVDQVMGEQEIVIKQLEGPVPKPVGVAGATVLGDGRIMPIADVLELIDLSMGRLRRDAGGSLWEQDGVTAMPEAPIVKTEPMVLIVDDSITVRELLSMTFNKVGYRVEQARDGQEAWEKLRSGLPCDIVFCDIEMPRMDGLELLSRIQKDINLKHLPIAMLTSRGADRHRQMAASLGASGYFTKPYLEEALLDAAQRMLKGERLLSNG